MDEVDRKKMKTELEKCTHPLNDKHHALFNICNGQVAPDTVNVQDALAIGSDQSKHFSASLNEETSTFHATIKKRVNNLELLKKCIKVKGKAVYDMETLFGRLLVVGEQRGIDMAEAFNYELSPVPPALLDEFGCLRKGGKAALVRNLAAQRRIRHIQM